MSVVDYELLKNDILAHAPPDGFEVKFVAIDGHGGAGKTTIAGKLANLLNAQIIHTDDFASPDNYLDWWPKLVRDVFDPIRMGYTKLNYQPTSWWPDHHPAPVKDQPVTPIIIIEGVASARKEMRPYLSYAIWVETPRKICLERGLDRDGQDKLEIWESWLEDEDDYAESHKPQDYANIVVNGYDD